MNARMSRRAAGAGLLAAVFAPSLARAQPYPNDTLIVPGVRIGGVYLGMQLPDLLVLQGEPEQSQRLDNGAYVHTWEGTFHVQASDQVTDVWTWSSRYALADGLAAGSSVMALQARRPDFYRREHWSDAWNDGPTIFSYDDGVRFYFGQPPDRVGYVAVFLRGQRITGPSGPGDFECDLGNRRCRRR